MMAIRLRTQSVLVLAPRELCFEVVAAAGREVEEVSPSERIVEFKSEYRGRDVLTLERLRLSPPERIDYEWLKGPLPDVRESISFDPDGPGRTRITYEGTFDVEEGLIARVVGRVWIKPAFDRIVLEHLVEAKRIAESRAKRSHLYPSDTRKSGGAVPRPNDWMSMMKMCWR